MIGKQILNYEIKSLLGEGGMGNVYLAEHTQLGRKVAIKMLHPKLVANQALRERFKNEAAAMAKLQHPGIVTLYDYLESEDGLFLVMEYVEGMELNEYIDKVTGPVSEEETIKIMNQVLSAFEYAHAKGVVHRDIKPSNILLTKEGEVKILDFGLAKLLGEDKTLTKTGTQMGTVLYMSPEQVKGLKVDHRSDIYALGVMLHQMITGQLPYSTDSAEYEIYNRIVKEPLTKASEIYPGATTKMESIISKATEKEAENRFQTCQQFIDALSTQDGLTNVAATTANTADANSGQSTESTTNKIQKETITPKPAPPVKKKRKRGTVMLVLIIAIGVIGGSYLGYTNWARNNGNGVTTEGEAITEKTVFVLTSILNFREDKTVDAPIIEPLHFGDRLELVGSPESPITQDGMDIVWQQAEYNGRTGWIAKSIDGQEVVGNEEQKNSYQALFANEYTEDAIYGEMKVWAYNALIEFLENEENLNEFTIRSDGKDIRKKGLKTIVAVPSNPSDKKSPDDYFVLLDNGQENLAVYLLSEGENVGRVAGHTILEEHVAYLFEKEKGDEYPYFEYGGVSMIELQSTSVGTADLSGTLTGWMKPDNNSLDWEANRLVESSDALNMLFMAGGADFGTESDWLDYISGYTTNPKLKYEVSCTANGNKFWAVEKSRNILGGFNSGKEVVSEFKDGRFVTEDIDKAKLFIDIQENRLLLYIRKNKNDYGSTYFGMISPSFIEGYESERNHYDEYDDEAYGC